MLLLNFGGNFLQDRDCECFIRLKKFDPKLKINRVVTHQPFIHLHHGVPIRYFVLFCGRQ